MSLSGNLSNNMRILWRKRAYWLSSCLVLAAVACSELVSPPKERLTHAQLEPATLEDVQIATLALADWPNISLDEACDILYPDAPFVPEVSVGMLVADLNHVDDGNFFRGVFDGVDAVARCFGVQTSFLESPEGKIEMSRALIEQDGIDIVVSAIGGASIRPLVDLAEQLPDVRFISVDEANSSDLPNLIGLMSDDWQVGYLAGVAAGMSTSTGQVGVIAGPDFVKPVVDMADGFEAGAAAVSKDARVTREHLSSFYDPGMGATKAAEYVASGVDVLFGAAGATGGGAIKAAAVSKIDVIGVDVDEYFTTFEGGAVPGADRLLTSVVKRADLGVLLSVAAFLTSDLTGGNFFLNAANGGIAYTDSRSANVSAVFMERLEQARLDLVSGSVARPGR